MGDGANKKTAVFKFKQFFYIFKDKDNSDWRLLLHKLCDMFLKNNHPRLP